MSCFFVLLCRKTVVFLTKQFVWDETIFSHLFLNFLPAYSTMSWQWFYIATLTSVWCQQSCTAGLRCEPPPNKAVTFAQTPSDRHKRTKAEMFLKACLGFYTHYNNSGIHLLILLYFFLSLKAPKLFPLGPPLANKTHALPISHPYISNQTHKYFIFKFHCSFFHTSTFFEQLN